MDRSFGVIALFLIGTVLTMPFGDEKYFSCKDLKAMYPSYESGIYTIMLPCGEHQVYCEMAINGGGYTFIPSSLISQITQKDIRYLSKNQDDVLLRISRPDGTQPYTIITPYVDNSRFSIQASNHTEHDTPINKHLGPYIFLNTLPGAKQVNNNVTAFKSNGHSISYQSCPAGWKVRQNHFAFYSNPYERQISSYHRSNPVYEKIKVAVDWRKTARRPYSGRRIPLEYFLLTEMHYGGCGCYTSSERWLTAVSPALGAAIGLR